MNSTGPAAASLPGFWGDWLEQLEALATRAPLRVGTGFVAEVRDRPVARGVHH